MHTYDPLGLLRVLDDLEQFARSSNDHAAIGAVRESRGALEKLVNKMDSLETGFDRIAERSCKGFIHYDHIILTNKWTFQYYRHHGFHLPGDDVGA